MAVWADTQDWLDWWYGELRSSWQRALPFARAASLPDLVLVISRSGFRVIAPNGVEAPSLQSSFGSEALGERLGAAAGTAHPNVELRFGQDRFLERRLAAVRLPTRRLFGMAALDLQSATPLDPANTVSLFAQGGQGSPGAASYFVVKRDLLEELIASVEGSGATVTSLSVDTKHGIVPVSSKSITPLLKGMRRQSRWKHLALAGIAACVIAALSTLAHAQWRLLDGAWRLGQEMEGLEAEAKAVRVLADSNKKRLDQLESARRNKRQAVPVTRVWDELTRVVPDGSWVTDLTVKESRVTFSGFSPSAAGLIPQIEASPLFADPTFAGPVSKSPDNQGERFTIDMRLEG